MLGRSLIRGGSLILAVLTFTTLSPAQRPGSSVGTGGRAPASGGFSAPRSAPSGGGFAAPRSAPSGGGFITPRSAPSGGGFSAPRSAPSGGGFSAPRSSGGFSQPRSAPSSGGYAAPRSSGGSNYSAPSRSRGYEAPSAPNYDSGYSGSTPSRGLDSRGGDTGAAPRSSGVRSYPYGTNKGPTLYRSPSQGGDRGTSGFSTRGRGARTSLPNSARLDTGSTGTKLGTSGARSPSAGGRLGGDRAKSPNVGVGRDGTGSRLGATGADLKRSGGSEFRGFSSAAGASTKSASEFRNQLAARTGRSGAAKDGTAIRSAPRSAVSAGGVKGGGTVPSSVYAGTGGTGNIYYGSTGNYSSTVINNHYYHHPNRYYCDDDFHFSFYFGYHGFSFGYWNGYHCGYYPSWYFPHFYAHTYCYPYYGHSWWPYYWSYRYYRSYRRYWWDPPAYYVRRVVYVYEDDGSRTSYGYLPANADDPYAEAPYVEEEAEGAASAPSRFGRIGGEKPLAESGDAEVDVGDVSKPFLNGVDVGAGAEDALRKGDEYLKAGKNLEAAEAYRTAYQRSADPASASRLSVALLAVGDFSLASWALVQGVGGGEKAFLDFGALLDDLLGGPRVTTAVKALERSLVKRPNDEASNLLVAAIYTLTGRSYAATIVLSRLEAANYEPATVSLIQRHAQAALEK